MPYDSKLAARLTRRFKTQGVAFEAKAMIGGLCFMVDGKMCVGVSEDRLMVRLDPALYANALTKPGCRPMDFTGRPLKGFVFVTQQGLDTAKRLNDWLNLALKLHRPETTRSDGRRRIGCRQQQPSKGNMGNTTDRLHRLTDIAR